MAVEKVTFTLPEELVRRLEKVPAGKRSMLVRKAVEKETRPRSSCCSAQKDAGKGHLERKVSPEFAHL